MPWRAVSAFAAAASVVTVGIGVGGSGSAVGFDAGLSHAAATTAIMIAIEINRELRDIRGIRNPVSKLIRSAHSAPCERVSRSSEYILFAVFERIVKILVILIRRAFRSVHPSNCGLF
jgi:hypothetical protein